FSVLATRYPVLTAELLDSFSFVSTPGVLPSSKLLYDDLVEGGAMAIPLRGNDPSVREIPEDTEARSSSADVPTYDSYPAEPPRSVDWKGRQERWREFDARSPRLNETAEKIGRAVGDMVNR